MTVVIQVFTAVSGSTSGKGDPDPGSKKKIQVFTVVSGSTSGNMDGSE